MTLSEELAWRGFVNQTTYKDLSVLDGDPITFYWGVDPSADSMQVGNLAAAMMVRQFIMHGHKPILLVGGATGMIGDPDGKKQERNLLSLDDIARNKAAISKQYRQIFAGQELEIVDNYDWFKGMGYLQFLREVGKHAPMRQMLGRDFVQSRLGEDGAGISYAEFSYSLIQGYDFLHLYRKHGVTLQVCGADQWGNSVAGVDLIRRIEGAETHVYSTPLIVNKATGVKFGKSEAGAVWLDPAKTPPAQFYQFWINADDEGVEDYLKVYTELDRPAIDGLMAEHRADPKQRHPQKRLAYEVTTLVHGEAAARDAQLHAENLRAAGGGIGDGLVARADASIIDTLLKAELVGSKSEGRRVLNEGGVYINDQPVTRETFTESDFTDRRLLLRRGKKLQHSVIVTLQG